MWVRSQNKKFLGNYDSFSVSESGIIIGYQGPEDCEGAILGSYENEEKALNVLDELQIYIGLSESTSHQGVQTINKAIFEMPIGINKEVAK